MNLSAPPTNLSEPDITVQAVCTTAVGAQPTTALETQATNAVSASGSEGRHADSASNQPITSNRLLQSASPIPASIVHVPVAVNCTAPRRFRFNEQLDMLLLRSVLTAGAHVAPWGKTQELYERAFEFFVSSQEFKAIPNAARPSWKTLSDRFKKIIADRRSNDRRNASASGIAEAHGEKEQLMDDIIGQMEEWQEAERAEKEEKSSEDKKLQEAGEEMPDKALRRQRKHKGRSSRSPPGIGSLSSESDPEMKMISMEVETRKIAEQARQRIGEERLHLERKRFEREEARDERAEERESRRLKIDERRTELEEMRFEAEAESRRESQKERKLALEERKSMINVLSALADKLNK